MLSNVEIYPEPDGKFAFDNGKLIRVCDDADDVGANLETMLWPLVAPALKAKKAITIKIEYGTN